VTFAARGEDFLNRTTQRGREERESECHGSGNR